MPVGVGTITTDAGNLVYSIDVAADSDDGLIPHVKNGGIEGDVITFRINHTDVGTGVWHGSTNIELNFASITLGGLNQTYDGTQKSVTTTTDPLGLAVNVTYDNSATPPTNAGIYAVVATITAPNYTGTANGTLVVAKATATVTANDKSKAYGDDNPVLDATVVGQVAGGDAINYSLATTAVKFAGVGSYPIVVTLNSNPNYNITKTDGTLVVAKATATVTANDKSKTYGDDNPALDATVVGQVAGGDAINYSLATTAAKFAGVGSYPIVVTLNSNPNYNVTKTDGTLVVNKATLMITANNRSKSYGDTVTFVGTEFTTVGLVNGDSVSSVTLTSAGAGANATVAGSPYAIVASAATGTGLDNYTIAYIPGVLTIDPKALTITANDRSKTYGTTVTFVGTEFTTVGLVNGDSVSSVTLTSAGAAASATVAGSPYAIVASAATGTGLGNYTISYTDGSLTIGKATPVIVWPTPADIHYGIALSGIQLNATELHGVAGTFVYAPLAGTILNPGNNQPLNVTFTPTDVANYNTADAHVTINVLGNTHSIALVSGWNLVSFNLIPDDTSIATVLASLGTNYDLVYVWDATGTHSGAGNWMKYDRSAPAYQNTLSVLDEKMGFWIHMAAADTLEVAGRVPTTTNIALDTHASGWNLVGYPATGDGALPSALSGHGVSTDFSLVYAYHAYDTGDTWKLFDRTAPAWSERYVGAVNGLGLLD